MANYQGYNDGYQQQQQQPGGFQGYPPPQDQHALYGPPGAAPYGQGPPGPYGPQGGYGPPGGYGNPGVIQQQPQLTTPVPANCPRGLEYLSMLNQLVVKQKVELLEAFVGWESGNKYKVMNSLGQPVYYAKEESDCCTRQCCGNIRPFELTICDNSAQEVIFVERPLRCDSCFFPCCLQRIEVQAPRGNVIGVIEQNWTLCKPSFNVLDGSGQKVLGIEGPFCTMSFCGSDVNFGVVTNDGDEVGLISKQWTGLVKEHFTDADNFGVSFPQDMDVRIKATLLAAVFLVDFMFFEKSGDESQDGIGMLS